MSTSADPRRNVECKARDPRPDRSRAVCAELGADDRGLLRQRDTYFAVGAAGRRRLIHLDEVDGLGSFVELEAVAPPDSDLAAEHALVAQLRERLAITDDRLVATGYADLLADAG